MRKQPAVRLLLVPKAFCRLQHPMRLSPGWRFAAVQVGLHETSACTESTFTAHENDSKIKKSGRMF